MIQILRKRSYGRMIYLIRQNNVWPGQLTASIYCTLLNSFIEIDQFQNIILFI